MNKIKTQALIPLDNETLRSSSAQEKIIQYLNRHLALFSPLDLPLPTQQTLAHAIQQTLARFAIIARKVKAFDSENFNLLNSLQYATFIYLLSRAVFEENSDDTQLADRLFLLNKAINGLELYYRTQLPEVFFISHGNGAVLGDASYGTDFVFFQNVTVGRVGENRPTIGRQVVMYPYSSITGKCNIGNNCVVSAGVHLHNQNIPENSIVKIVEGRLSIYENDGRIIQNYLNI